MQKEESLLDADGNRVTLPTADFVLEGPKCTATPQEHGGIEIDNNGSMCVLWYTAAVQNDIIIDLNFSPKNTSDGLGIVFWNSLGLDGSSIFALNQPPRYGDFPLYTNGNITNYRTTYFGTNPGEDRAWSTIRKDPGAIKTAQGPDLVGGS